MPELDLLSNGEISITAPIDILAAMFYPTDEEKRNQFLASEVVGRIIDEHTGDDGITPGPSLLKALWKCPGPEKTRQQAFNQTEGGCIAGDVFLFVLNHSADGGSASLRKAEHVIAADIAQVCNYGGEQLKGVSERTVRKHWGAFRSVAHLWGAYRLKPDLLGSPLMDWRPCRSSSILPFLAVAEILRNWGERLTTEGHGGKYGPVLDPETTWKVPDGLDLPPVTLGIPPLTDWARDQLEEYTPRR